MHFASGIGTRFWIGWIRVFMPESGQKLKKAYNSAIRTRSNNLRPFLDTWQFAWYTPIIRKSLETVKSKPRFRGRAIIIMVKYLKLKKPKKGGGRHRRNLIQAVVMVILSHSSFSGRPFEVGRKKLSQAGKFECWSDGKGMVSEARNSFCGQEHFKPLKRLRAK